MFKMTLERIKDYRELAGLERIMYFSDEVRHVGDIICLEIDGKLMTYEIYSKPKEQETSIKTYYAMKR